MGCSDVIVAIACYGLFSSILLVINKLAIYGIPLPAFVFFVQFATSVTFILALRIAGAIQADPLTAARVRRFLPYVGSFVISIYCNGKVLQYMNVETLITFRCCTPIFVSVLEWQVLGRELPSRRSFLALLGVVLGASLYVLCDSEFQLRGLRAYGWVFVYLAGNVFEMTYGKFVMARAEFEAPVWGSVFYTNALAVGPMFCVAALSGELGMLLEMDIGVDAIAMLGMCSIAGIGISWAGWNCRNKVSATSYTLVGVGSKLISVLLNVVIWEKHASQRGLAALLLCLLSSVFYEQAPMRSQKSDPWTSTYSLGDSTNKSISG
jgi:GDP-mannose transporter